MLLVLILLLQVSFLILLEQTKRFERNFLDSKNKISVNIKSNKLRIYIDDTLNLSIDISNLVGIYAYKYGDSRFNIDFITKTTSIKCWYEKHEIWKNILDGISKLDLV